MTLRERIAELAQQEVLTLPADHDRRGRYYSDEELESRARHLRPRP